MKVIKRDIANVVDFNKKKIVIAIEKAMRFGSGVHKADIANEIADEIFEESKHLKTITVGQIEELVYDKLTQKGQVETAKAYEGYRAVQEYKRQKNTTDDSILGLVNQTNESVMRENSNKDATLNSTLRDLLAGEVSKDMVSRKLYPPHIVQAHKEGLIHLHDRDYLLQKLHNCTVVGLEDMLMYGTVINGKQISSPKSFQVAATVTTQIIAQITSSQYGGASINGIDRILAPYVRKSYDKYYEKYATRLENEGLSSSKVDEKAKEWAWEDTTKEVKDGVQTIQYQINTLSGSNGQSPFVTFLLYFQPDYEYAKEAELIQGEIIKQRYEGIPDESGLPMPTSFPKLIYVLDEHNIHEDSPYYHMTELAVKSTAKTLMPDYISAKKMREVYDGNVFVPIDKPVA